MRKNMINSNMKSFILAGILIAAIATTAYAGVKACGVKPQTGHDTTGPSVPVADMNQEAVKPEAGMEFDDAFTNNDASDLQINYYDTEEAGGIMTLEAANHWARFDFFSNPTIGEDWSYTMDNNILDVEKTYTAKDPSDTMNINDGTTRFVLTPNALGTVTVTFNYGKAGAEPDDTMIYTFLVDEDLRITLVKAENPHGDKSMIVRPVVK